MLRAPLSLGLGVLIGFLAPYLIYLDSQVRARFDDLSWDLPSRVYARPLELKVGLPMTAEALTLELEASRYTSDASARTPGSYAGTGARFVIATRAFTDGDGREPARRVSVSLSANSVTALANADSGAAIEHLRIDPARIATLYGAEQEERRVVTLEQLPPLLVAGLQAVEDRDFKHHRGIAISAILRALFADLSAGHVVQGGSTLTQQLVKNLFLDRGQRITRKLNEILIALLIEARYDKQARRSRSKRRARIRPGFPKGVGDMSPWPIDSFIARFLLGAPGAVLFRHQYPHRDTPLGRKLRPKMLATATPLIRVKPKTLVNAGIASSG